MLVRLVFGASLPPSLAVGIGEVSPANVFLAEALAICPFNILFFLSISALLATSTSSHSSSVPASVSGPPTPPSLPNTAFHAIVPEEGESPCRPSNPLLASSQTNPDPSNPPRSARCCRRATDPHQSQPHLAIPQIPDPRSQILQGGFQIRSGVHSPVDGRPARPLGPSPPSFVTKNFTKIPRSRRFSRILRLCSKFNDLENDR